jgi:hypothetical protein
MTNLDTEMETTVTVTYGVLVSTADDTSGKIKGSRYILSFHMDIMGKSTQIEAGGVDMSKASESLVVAFNGDVDEYEFTYDEDDEFFSQKYAAPKADANDVWTNDKYAANRDELDALRGTAEGALAAAQDGEKAAQGEALEVARVIKRAFEIVGTKKALQVWAKGTVADGENMKLLSSLGKGANALSEAMRLAELSDAEYALLPASLTSGKGVDTHTRNSVKAVVENAAPEKMSDLDTSKETPSIEGVEMILRQFAAQACGIGEAFDMELVDLPKEVDGVCVDHAGEFSDKFGKSVNTYDTVQLGAARRAYGYLRISTMGRGLFAAGVEAVDAYHLAESDDDREKVMSGLFSKTGGNAMLKEMYAAAKAHQATVSREKVQRDAVQAVANDDVKLDSTKWADLEPLAAAARLYARMQAHPQRVDVSDALKGLLAQAPKVAVAAE